MDRSLSTWLVKSEEQITFSMDWESSFIKSSFERSETFSKEKVLATSRTQSSTCNMDKMDGNFRDIDRKIDRLLIANNITMEVKSNGRPGEDRGESE